MQKAARGGTLERPAADAAGDRLRPGAALADHFRAIARNNAWANDRLLETCARLSAAEFAAELAPADLPRRVATDRGHPVPERIDRLLAHLLQHQIHRRGQAHAMLACTAVAPPQLDEFFLDFDRHPSAAEGGWWPIPE